MLFYHGHGTRDYQTSPQPIKRRLHWEFAAILTGQAAPYSKMVHALILNRLYGFSHRISPMDGLANSVKSVSFISPMPQGPSQTSQKKNSMCALP